MPYAPTERNDPSPIFAGLSSAGAQLAAGMDAMNQDKQKMDNLELSARMLASQNPDIVDPETLAKFAKGSLGQREALVGQMTAAVANKFRTQQMGMEQQKINIEGQRAATDATLGDRRLSLGERGQQFDEQKAQADISAMVPRFKTDDDGTKYMYVPASRQLPQPVTKRLIPAPGGKTDDVVTDADGKPAYKLKWDPVKGEYQHFDIRPKAAGLDALLGAPPAAPGGTAPAAPGSTPAPAGASAGTTQPPAAPAAAAKFNPGQVYRDAKGNKARYNADGSWTPL